MTFEEIKPLIDKLSMDDVLLLNDYLHQQFLTQSKEMDLEDLLDAAEEIRLSMSEEDLDEMLALMNEEYIEDVDNDK